MSILCWKGQAAAAYWGLGNKVSEGEGIGPGGLDLPQLQATWEFRPKSNDLLPAKSLTDFFDLLCPGNGHNLIDLTMNTTTCFE